MDWIIGRWGVSPNVFAQVGELRNKQRITHVKYKLLDKMGAYSEVRNYFNATKQLRLKYNRWIGMSLTQCFA